MISAFLSPETYLVAICDFNSGLHYLHCILISGLTKYCWVGCHVPKNCVTKTCFIVTDLKRLLKSIAKKLLADKANHGVVTQVQWLALETAIELSLWNEKVCSSNNSIIVYQIMKYIAMNMSGIFIVYNKSNYWLIIFAFFLHLSTSMDLTENSTRTRPLPNESLFSKVRRQFVMYHKRTVSR